MKKNNDNLTKRFNKFLDDWGKLNIKAQLSSIITVFLLIWYIFIGRKQIELWKVIVVWLILIFGITTTNIKEKRGKKDANNKQQLRKRTRSRK